MKSQNNKLEEEFKEFLDEPAFGPPASLSERVLSEVHKKLNPNSWLVFSKLSLVHFFGGLITLSMCPQFGINLLGADLGLIKVFYRFGTYGCVTACGALFISLTTILALITLRPEEIRKVRQLWFLQIATLSLLSLGVFLMLDADILWSFAIFWIIGGLLGGLMTLEVGMLAQRKLLFQ